MTVKTQGTDLFGIDPRDNSLIVVGCVTTIDGIDSSVEQIETTCLNSGKDRKYVSGMGQPGNASFGINIDPSDLSHLKLYQLKQLGLTLKWAIGWGDGPMQPDGTIDLPPEVVNDDFDLPDGRSWLLFEGYMSSFPFSFNLNDVVKSAVGIQISGTQVLIPKASGGSSQTRARFGYGTATAGAGSTAAALFAAMQQVTGATTDRNGTLVSAPGAGLFTWVAVRADAITGSSTPAGVIFTHQESNSTGAFSGALSSGAFTGLDTNPSEEHQTYTDENGVAWWLLRSSLANTTGTFNVS